MKRTTFSVTFYCRESKADKKGYAPIEVSLTMNGARTFINTPRKETPATFKKQFESKKDNEIKQYCELMRGNINSAINDLMANSIPVTTASIREYIQGGGIKSYTICDLFCDYLEILKARIGTTISKGVYRKYELVWEQFQGYINKNDECTAITPAIIKRVHADMYAKYDASTAAGYMTKLKTFITFGIDNNKININPFQGIKIDKGHKEIEYLNEKEIQKLIDTPIDNESLSKVRDCALFQIGSGIAYCDVVALCPEDVVEEEGKYYISKKRQKTGTEFCAVLLPFAAEIWKKYNGKLPIISNQKYNCYLKTIGTLCNLSTTLHSHLFRHTYCTFLLNRGVAIKTISKAVGHTNSKITESFYAHLQNKTIINEVSAIFQ